MTRVTCSRGRRALLAMVFVGASAASLHPSASARGGQAQPQPARDAAADRTAALGKASIRGTVVVAGSGVPARRARITLSGTELRGARRAQTDDLGRFAFPALPAGRYTLSASKPGHVPVSYGQRTPGAGRAGTPIQLADAQQVEVQLQIPRGGVITGVVLDEHGEAVPGTPVRVLRYVLRTGTRTLQQAGSGSTDDRGVYRVYGLQPGDYVVSALPRNTNASSVARVQAEMALRIQAQRLSEVDPSQAAGLAERLRTVENQVEPEDDEPASGYAPVFYPGTTTASAASIVPVGLSEERSGVDFQLQLVPIAHIDGLVVGPDGQEIQGTQVMLVNSSESVSGIGNSNARANREGRFRFSNVAPGQYTLMARGNIPRPRAQAPGGTAGGLRGGRGGRGSDATRLWAMASLSVDGRNLSNVVLTLQTGMSIAGQIQFSGTSEQPPSDLSRIRVSVAPADPGFLRGLAMVVAGQVDASGRFTVSGVAPGRYRIAASGGGPNWSLASAVVGDQDVLDFPLDVKPNQHVSGAILTFTDRRTELSGSIVDERGQPATDYTIVVFPSDSRYWTPQSRRIRSTRPATDGRYVLSNLPAGDYRIAPVLDPEPGSWYDPAFLQQLDNNALRVILGEGEKKVQSLRIGF